MAGSAGRYRRTQGRFFRNPDEYRRIDRDMETYQESFGTTVLWYFYNSASSVVDDIYDEGSVFGGKAYLGPLRIPVLSAFPLQGTTSGDTGLATYDRVTLRCSLEQTRARGFDEDLIAQREDRLLDRFTYRDRVFRVTEIQTGGHFGQQSLDTVFEVQGEQLRPDELVDSPVFAMDAYPIEP